ncbi:putative mitochondrial protein [Cucumis melo var. makuwa]|uniref:Mitochondrial protein n=1 Tax=Cucumis melo var. makuwa TaxID=1194695 RepID=A0A5A7UBV3_CUCMM|nr:putative mitochondrial protein [Cucumis melo var. makuwa]TYK02695.1 putative mitochondrial protein [Cucumis melo var. makuwa]
MMEDPILGIAHVIKPFTVETDASNYALGDVLLQNGHLIAYESRKLNAAEKRYIVFEKEMLAMDKIEKANVVGLLDPLPVPTRLWESVSMDFITHLPKTSSSIGRSPFEIICGRQPVLPHLVDHHYVGKNPQAHNFMEEWKQTTDRSDAP